VLQSPILTEGARMVLTPTYHVFEMYKVHQDAALLPIKLDCGSYQYEDKQVPSLNASASVDGAGVIHVSLCNLHPTREESLSCTLDGVAASSVSGRVLTADAMNAHNTFAQPALVQPQAFSGAKLAAGGLSVTLPPMSVAVLEIR
jgi:alpha-L-arabinofuranosidase